MDPALLAAARAAVGFMPDDEGLALYRAGLDAGGCGPLLEVGSYCGKSTLYLAAAARQTASLTVSVDHHRGSEEHQPGWDYHDPGLIDPGTGRLDTLGAFRRTIASAGVEDVVVAVVAPSTVLASLWSSPLGLVFLDGSHTDASAQADYDAWAGHLTPGGLLVIHDVYADPAEGGQAPYRVYRRAVASGEFTDVARTGSLRVLRRVS